MVNRPARLLGGAVLALALLTVPAHGVAPSDLGSEPTPRLVVFELFTPPLPASGGG